MAFGAFGGIAGLSFIFLITAGFYASVGFGGGSTYIALLALVETDYRILPILALLCNIIVVTGGTIRFQVRQLVEWSKIWPILLLSVPAAWAGGRIAIDQTSFLILLGVSLMISAILLLFEPLFHKQGPNRVTWARGSLFAPAVGSIVGFVSGLVGIGGGIFLAPILYLFNWSGSRQIAATASVFILVNSLSGLAGQLMKADWQDADVSLHSYWPLFFAVLIGGQLGSHLASRTLAEQWIKRLTAMLILYVAARIFWQQLQL